MEKQQPSIMSRVILQLYLQSGRETTMKNIIANTGLKITQIYSAMAKLKEMHILEIRREKFQAGKGQLPNGKCFYKLKDNRIDWVRKKLTREELI
jgi:predicted transcriptional regulator